MTIKQIILTLGIALAFISMLLSFIKSIISEPEMDIIYSILLFHLMIAVAIIAWW